MIDKLKNIGLIPIKWIGKCEADRISQGTYDVPRNEGGNYGLVFDNTFSKQTSKTLTLVLLTYPTAVPPQSIHQARNPPAHSTSATNSSLSTQDSSGNNSRTSTTRAATTDTSSSTLNDNRAARSLPQGVNGTNGVGPKAVSSSSAQAPGGSTALVFTGILQKRRRKRHQGWARRYFSLDFNSSTLSYYHDRNSTVLRGAIPLSLAAIAANENSREISVDSGAEIWHLRASNEQDFANWKGALERASNVTEDHHYHHYHHGSDGLQRVPSVRVNALEEREWSRVKRLAAQISASREMVRQLAKDPMYLPSSSPSGRHPRGRSVSPNGEESTNSNHARDLSLVVTEFKELFTERNDRLRPKAAVSAHSRKSVDSDVSEEFFDAEDGGSGAASPILTIRGDSDDDEDGEVKQADTVLDDASSDSDSDEESDAGGGASSSSLFPVKPRSLAPLPLEKTVKLRQNVNPPTQMPPSLIGFLRKNVGKDLSQISMPVSANEPLSLLQRASEIMEYSPLLDNAAAASDSAERLIRVTAYAISTLSSNRVRERAIRKPFNPMLGETYELVREDLGFRFISEKVSHRPVQLAYQADGKEWSFTQSPMPTQKFWGKSAEIITEGVIRLSLHSTGEHFSWSAPASFLRNIIAGEKYVEPSGELYVFNETTGERSVSIFKAGGMFSGRSEEVVSKAYDARGKELALGLTGTWTNSLQLVKNGSPTSTTVWSAGLLVADAPKHYGMTRFAAALNEFTSVENEKTLPSTDSRMRSDQRALEDGDVDRAEDEKVRLEEAQRARRREYEDAGKQWIPRWFARVEDGVTAGDGTEIVWYLKTGKDGYWDERSRGTWTGVTSVL